LTNNHTYGYNKNNILGSKLVEETIDVDRVKGEVEEGPIMKDDSVHIVIKQIIQWMNATLDMDILHGINIGHISLSLQSNHKERECAELWKERKEHWETEDQIQKLLQLLDSSSYHNINQIQGQSGENFNSETQQKSTNSWILDTGATDHVTYNKRYFITFYKIKHVNVKLPNGTYVKAYNAGLVQFSNDFIIFNVLYIPNFHSI